MPKVSTTDLVDNDLSDEDYDALVAPKKRKVIRLPQDSEAVKARKKAAITRRNERQRIIDWGNPDD